MPPPHNPTFNMTPNRTPDNTLNASRSTLHAPRPTPQPPHPPLPRSFYHRHAVTVARALLGQRLVRDVAGERVSGIIVETEAYLGTEDQAAHTANGRRTQRNASMWGEGGHAYVYFTYGMHYCFNVVASRVDDPVAVLVRAVEPIEGLELMRHHRGNDKPDRQLCSGPAKLCQALGIDRALDGADLVHGAELWIERERQRAVAGSRIAVTPRVGINYGGPWIEAPLRFYLKESPYVSRR